MYIRLLYVKVKQDGLASLGELYGSVIIPAMQTVPGCIHASLIKSVGREDECISMTLWRDRQAAEAYERSGMFRRLLDQAMPFLADSSEWRIQLSQDLTLKYEPVPEEPVLKSYAVTAAQETAPPSHETSLFVRIVSPRLRPGMGPEFKRIYAQEVLPALLEVKGCRYAYLSENVNEPDQFLSITIWDSRRSAEEYERSGKFDSLIERLRRTFTEVYQWKMQLERETGGQVITSDDVTVSGYSVLTGKSFI